MSTDTITEKADAGQNSATIITIPAPSGNRRRAYGLEFRVNGKVPVTTIVARSGDVIEAHYLGGNVAAYPEQGKARDAIRAVVAFEKVGRKYGPVTLP